MEPAIQVQQAIAHHDRACLLGNRAVVTNLKDIKDLLQEMPQ